MLDWTNPRKVGDDYYFTFKYQKKDGKKISPLSALEAAQYTIEHIVKNYPAPYTLYLSGGVDSQAMLYAWHKSGVPFKTFSAIYNESLNDYDIINLKEFSEHHNISIDYRDFDLISFLENEHDYYANEYRCGSPQITTFMKLADLTTEGTVIFSGQYIMYQKNNGNLGIPDKNNFGLYYYGIKSNKNIVPFFFLETCELAYAFDVMLPEIQQFHTSGSYMDKVKAFQLNGFPVIEQEKEKGFNGFEKIKTLYDTNPPRQPTIQEKISRIQSQTSNRNFDLLYRNKYEARFIKYKYVTSSSYHVMI